MKYLNKRPSAFQTVWPVAVRPNIPFKSQSSICSPPGGMLILCSTQTKRNVKPPVILTQKRLLGQFQVILPLKSCVKDLLVSIVTRPQKSHSPELCNHISSVTNPCRYTSYGRRVWKPYQQRPPLDVARRGLTQSINHEEDIT